MFVFSSHFISLLSLNAKLAFEGIFILKTSPSSICYISSNLDNHPKVEWFQARINMRDLKTSPFVFWEGVWTGESGFDKLPFF